MMTEDQAKTKWCPYARVQITDTALKYVSGTTGNRLLKVGSSGPLKGSTCIASECMAWRSQEWREPHESPDVGGYCGLAGRPA